jgi:hypothetical protein
MASCPVAVIVLGASYDVSAAVRQLTSLWGALILARASAEMRAEALACQVAIGHDRMALHKRACW